MNGKKIRFFMVVFWGVALAFHANAQRMVVDTGDGSDTLDIVNTLQKFSFSDDNLLVDLIGGSVKTYNLAGVRKISFVTDGSIDVPTAITDPELSSAQGISLYPNPAENMLYLKNLPEGISLCSIYTAAGILVLSVQTSGEGNSINISNLPKGLYLIRINNQALKFIKL
jgi:hypothetical protein